MCLLVNIPDQRNQGEAENKSTIPLESAQSKGASRASAEWVGLLFAGRALFSQALQSRCTARPGGRDIQMHQQNNVGLQLFSDSFAHLPLSDSELEWSLGKQCISQEWEVFHPFLELPWCFCMHGTHRPV